METIEERLARLEQKLRQLEEARKQQQASHKRALDAQQERARDTRREILAGAAVLAAVKTGEWPRDKLLALLDLKLLRRVDRDLFGLPPLDLPLEVELELELEDASALHGTGPI